MSCDLTISVVNHSNPNLLKECLRSIYRSTHKITLDIWVIDNATDGTGVTDMQQEFPAVKWLFNTQRLGFSANHNQVLSQAKTPYVCILNDDTVIHDGAFDTLVHYMKENPGVGMVGARLLNSDGSQQNCTFHFMTLWTELFGICVLPGFLDGLKKLGLDRSQTLDRPASVDWILGACIVTRDETIQQVGLLDSSLSPIANTEEVDWCYRTHKAGWEVTYCPQAVITHLGGRSQQSDRPGMDSMRVEMYRTRIAFFRKHYGFLSAFLLRWIYLSTLPWNALMLTQSAVRKTTPRLQCQNAFATLCGIARVSLRPLKMDVGSK